MNIKKISKTHLLNSQTRKPVHPKRKINKINLWAIIVSGIACLGLICLVIGMIVIAIMLTNKPKLDINDFINSDSSIIYDCEGNQIAELGSTIRQNVTYEELPNCVVDAFVSVEDSRFFAHNGFDMPRFTKAILENLKSFSFSQGGSTFTMQLIKNTYFTNDETGEQASREGASGVKRKTQEIALAMELERKDEISKKTIFELYLNKLNFGGSRNIRGIEKASEYYFGKSSKDLNLSEAALLAGVINAPNAYNPFVNLEAATNRRNEVLYLMNYHGYITDEEYELAKCIKVEDLLIDDSNRQSSNGVAIKYQAYIDEVVAEIYELTGKDPYTNGMKIYTYMNPAIQETMDSIQNGTYEKITFPDDEFELASIAVNNHTGEIVGILGGRNYADGGSLLLNHAIDQKKQPGSSIKPILDYVLAFENLGWSTSHVLVDKPIVYPGTSTIIANSNGNYVGQVTLKDALGNSLNTPAIQALQAVIDAKGSDYVVNYLNSMGIDINIADFDVQNAIGGNKLQVSCLQMAAAQGALLNYGQYTKPHCISRIEFLDGRTPITPSYTSSQNVSQEAAFMISTLLQSNVNGGYANLMQILIDDYPVFAKTGTTDWADSGLEYGIPRGAIKDAWMIGSSTDFTVATWIGYERALKDKQSYINLNDYLGNIQGKTTNAILDLTVDEYGKPSNLEKPDGISEIRHILATFPYANPIEGMDEKYITNGFIKKEYAQLVDPQSVTVSTMSADPTIVYDNSTHELKITWPKYPDENAMEIASETMDISYKRSDGSTVIEKEGRRLFDYSWVYGPIKYKAEIKVNDTKVETVTSSTNTLSYSLTAAPGSNITVSAYYAYENQNISSTSRSASTTVEDHEISFTIPSAIDEIKEYLESLGSQVNEVTQHPIDGHPDGTISLTCNINLAGVESGSPFTPGGQYSELQSKLNQAQFTFTKYEDTDVYSFSHSVSATDNIYTIKFTKNGEKIDITSYTISGNSEQEQLDNGEIKVKINNGDSVTITVNYNGQQYTKNYTPNSN